MKSSPMLNEFIIYNDFLKCEELNITTSSTTVKYNKNVFFTPKIPKVVRN